MEKWVVVLLLLAVMELAPAEVTERYVGVGGELRVEPPKISGPITGVLWKHGVNLLAEWMKDSVDLTYYGQFKNRTTLNTITGDLQVRNMGVKDAGLYSVEINSRLQDLSYRVNVIEEVPDPEVWIQPVACTKEHKECTLSCDGKSPEAEPVKYEPVTYYWRNEEGPWVKSEKKYSINPTETDNVRTFSCRMENPISQKDSQPKDNPFFKPDGLSSGAQAGIALSIITILCAVAGGVWWFKFKRTPPTVNGDTNAAPANVAPVSGSSNGEGVPLKSTDSPDPPPV